MIVAVPGNVSGFKRYVVLWGREQAKWGKRRRFPCFVFGKGPSARLCQVPRGALLPSRVIRTLHVTITAAFSKLFSQEHQCICCRGIEEVF